MILVTMNRIVIFICVFFHLITGCRKDDQPQIMPVVKHDTIYPLTYFPAFPGSFWVYDSGDSLKVSAYEQYSFNTQSFTAIPDYDTLILPKFAINNIYPGNFYVKGYGVSRGTSGGYKDPAFLQVVSEKEGDVFTRTFPDQGHSIMMKVIKVDTTIQIGAKVFDHVIVTVKYDELCATTGGRSAEECAFEREYYAKNIGLIKREIKQGPEFTKSIELVEYYIQQ